MPYNLIKEVTLAMNDINFAGFESRVKEMIITLLEQPIKRIYQYDEIISELSGTMRKNVRRTNELDFILQKY